ncbi:MAG: PTS sugar transporter subunit IIA [Acholeplasmataceae bacterium]|jgi:fructose-specific phosphotransferase system IIA component
MIETLIDVNLIDLSLNARSKDGVFHELALLLHRNDRISDYSHFIEDVYEREDMGTTGFGFGIAIPHAKSPYVKIPSVCFGKSEQGISYDSIDGNPVYLVFMIAMPETDSKQHLTTLAWISRNLMHESFRKKLMEAKTPEEVINIILRANEGE